MNKEKAYQNVFIVALLLTLDFKSLFLIVWFAFLPTLCLLSAADAWYRVHFDFKVKRDFSSIRFYIQVALANVMNGDLPRGDCVRNGRDVTVDFWFKSEPKAENASDAILGTLLKCLELDDPNMTLVSQQCIPVRHIAPVPLPSPWKYTPGEGSPAAKKRDFSAYSEGLEAVNLGSDWSADRKKSTSQDASSDAPQNAHVLFAKRMTNGTSNFTAPWRKMISLVKLVSGPGFTDEQAVGVLEPLCQLTFPLLEYSHRLYDNLVFYYAWQYDTSSQTLMLSPRVIASRHMTEIELMELKPCTTIAMPLSTFQGTWRLALVLRKYLTEFDGILSDNGTLYPLQEFRTEWNNEQSLGSTCW
jgi:hypothetical protein